MSLSDTQSSHDTRGLAIARVGVKDIQLPLEICFGGDRQNTVALWKLYVGLPATQKGTHMSRFLQILDEPRAALDHAGILTLFAQMLEKLHADYGVIECAFPYFVRKAAPVSGITSRMNYSIRISVIHDQGRTECRYRIVVPVTSLCPCSKEISAYGAHNQRTHLTLDFVALAPISFARVIAAAEGAGSCALYGVLKRVDEKFVTEYAYDHPKFVEDLVRDAALALSAIANVGEYSVEAENFESIHNHSAYARIDGVGSVKA